MRPRITKKLCGRGEGRERAVNVYRYLGNLKDRELQSSRVNVSKGTGHAFIGNHGATTIVKHNIEADDSSSQMCVSSVLTTTRRCLCHDTSVFLWNNSWDVDAPLKSSYPAVSLHEVDALLPTVADQFSASVDAIFKRLLKLQRWVHQDVLPCTDENNTYRCFCMV